MPNRLEGECQYMHTLKRLLHECVIYFCAFLLRRPWNKGRYFILTQPLLRRLRSVMQQLNNRKNNPWIYFYIFLGILKVKCREKNVGTWLWFSCDIRITLTKICRINIRINLQFKLQLKFEGFVANRKTICLN